MPKRIIKQAHGRRFDRCGSCKALGSLVREVIHRTSLQLAAKCLLSAQLSDADRASAALDKAVLERDPGMISLKRDRFLDPIRRDPRFAALLTRLRFPPQI